MKSRRPGTWWMLAAAGLLALAACSPAVAPAPSPTAPAAVLPSATARPTATETLVPPSATLPPTSSPTVLTPTLAPTDTPEPEATATLGPDAWMEMPVIPTVSARAKEIYQKGIALGSNPRAFSKVGDCESMPWFLSDFDMGPRYYDLGEHADLQGVIDYFAGSYKRLSLAVRPGFTASSVLAPLWADPKQCGAGETPLACEYRLQKPSFALITLGSNNAAHLESYEPQMRKIIEYTIEQGIVPVLATKADNLEKDNSINRTTARLAYEYDIPLWNFWRAVQELPHKGLQDDGAHLTFAENRFGDPAMMQSAWPWRNLTALQLLDALRQVVR